MWLPDGKFAPKLLLYVEKHTPLCYTFINAEFKGPERRNVR